MNISIGGVLTPFAAPPVIMVAKTWNWDLGYMVSHFGWKAAVAVTLNTLLGLWLCKNEFKKAGAFGQAQKEDRTPTWLQSVYLVFLVLVILTVHHPKLSLGIFLFFLGVNAITKEYQIELQLRQSLLVAFFLGGLVVLGSLQDWWLEPLLQQLEAFSLFLGATVLTAFTDNAALTFLGAQISNVSESFKYALVAGAVSGGGLTIIANAPNPAGFSILKDTFGPEGINPLKLLFAALAPTLISMGCFWLLPTL